MSETTDEPATAFVSALVLDGRVYYAILMGKGRDGGDDGEVYRHVGRLPLYGDHRSLIEDVEADGFRTEDGVYDVVDLDEALRVVGRSMAGEKDLDAVLTAWDGMDDLVPALGLPFSFRGRLANRTRDKLFWGLNLPSVTPVGERYVPAWRRKEARKAVQALRAGASRLRTALADQERRAQPRETLWSNHAIKTDPHWWET